MKEYKLKFNVLFAAALTACGFLCAKAQTGTNRRDADQPGHAISPTLWGIFFEDINLSADGGIYPELVRNRSFEDSDQPEYWKFSNAAGGGSGDGD